MDFIPACLLQPPLMPDRITRTTYFAKLAHSIRWLLPHPQQ